MNNTVNPTITDVNFPLTEAAAPVDSTANALAYVLSVDGTGIAQLESSNIIMTPDGVVTSPIVFTDVIDTTILHKSQNVTASTAATTVDLGLGSVVNLNFNASTTITFTGLPPPNFVKLVSLYIKKDANANPYTLSLGVNTLLEGGVPLDLTALANAVDMILLLITSSGTIFARNTVLNFSVPGAPFVFTETAKDSLSRLKYPAQRVVGVEAGQLLTTKLDGSLNAVSIKTDGDKTITSRAELQNCVFVNENYSVLVKPATAAYDVSTALQNIIHMTQDVDITSFTVTVDDPTVLNYTLIIRQKDATATPRLIDFSNTVFQWDAAPILTQDPGAMDIIVIQSFSGINLLTVLNDFKV